MPQAAARNDTIAALPEVRALLDGAQDILKQDISRIKKLLADPHAILPAPVVTFTLDEARNALELLARHSEQLRRWMAGDISNSERAEVIRLQALVPEIRPLIQRLIALATELDKRARTGIAAPRKKWRH